MTTLNRSSIWVTRTGQMIRVGSMESDHLVRTIHFLQRWHESQVMAMLSIPPPRGEMAQDAWENEQDAMLECGPEDSAPIYLAMCDEADRRKLKYESSFWEGAG